MSSDGDDVAVSLSGDSDDDDVAVSLNDGSDVAVNIADDLSLGVVCRPLIEL